MAAGAALALAGVARDADAGGSRGFTARPGGSATASVVAHPHHGFHNFHSGVFVRGGVAVWPAAFYYWPGYYYAPAYYPPAYYPAAQQYWYYCPAVAAYYPYVQQCPAGWQPVRPAAPPPLG